MSPLNNMLSHLIFRLRTFILVMFDPSGAVHTVHDMNVIVAGRLLGSESRSKDLTRHIHP